MNALQTIYAVIVGWLFFSTAVWTYCWLTESADDEHITWFWTLIGTPIVLVGIAAIIVAAVGLIVGLVYIGRLLG